MRTAFLSTALQCSLLTKNGSSEDTQLIKTGTKSDTKTPPVWCVLKYLHTIVVVTDVDDSIANCYSIGIFELSWQPSL